jgi:hypothetical protein
MSREDKIFILKLGNQQIFIARKMPIEEKLCIMIYDSDTFELCSLA